MRPTQLAPVLVVAAALVAACGERRTAAAPGSPESGAGGADARSVLSLLELAVLASSEVEIVATGDDAEACVAAVASILTVPIPA